MTTIKVDTTVRDQFAAVARARGVTMAALLRDLASELEERHRWTVIDGAYERLRRDDPQGWAEYLAEINAWNSAASDPGDAAAEWPEFNP